VAQSSVGFFGKLPCKGDFLQRRVPQEFLDVWDPWLQECLHASRQSLQESWLSSYLTGPLWRFVLSSSVCGTGAYAGVLAPSVDRVGRYFPLTLVAQIDIDLCPLEFAATRTPWFEALEALIVVALDESTVDLESFDAQVAELAQPREPPEQGFATGVFELLAHSKFPAQGAAWRVPLGSAGGLQSAINALAYRDLAARLRPVSLWWSEGSNAAAPSWLSLRGLPAPVSFGAMLNGQWAQHGWQDVGELPGSPAQTPAAPGRADEVADRSDEPIMASPMTGSPMTESPMTESPVTESPITGSPAAGSPAAGSPVTGSPIAEAPIGLASPHVTLPAAQLTAIESNRAAFIVRPDVGLWATAAVGDAQEDTTALRLIAQALQQIAPAGSLTGLVEAVRQALSEVHEQLRYLSTRDVQRIDAQAQLIALLAWGNECALMSAGPIQTLRVRARVLEELGTDRQALPDDPGMLDDLLGADEQTTPPLGAGDFRHLRVHYERLQREDQWILCARIMIGSQHIYRLAAAAAGGMPLSVPVIIDTIFGPGALGAVPALMTVEV
jgi:type VI secretion system protein ImpM